MKIAHINMFYLPTVGGVEQVMYELATRQAKEGHEVHVFCCDSDKYERVKKKQETLEGVTIHRFPYWFRLSLNTFFWPSLLWRFSRYGKFDIIHTHVSGHDYILFAGVLSKMQQSNHIHTTHCPWTDSSFRPWYLRPFLFLNNLILNKIAFAFVDRIIAITPWELSILKKYSDEKKLRVIPNGMDKILYKKIKNNKFKKKHKIKEKNMILFFGRLNPTKGPEKLAQAAVNMINSGKAKDIAFVWVGPDEGKLEEVKKIIKPYKNLYYFPSIRDKKLIAEMYQAADIFVLPSYREGLPLTLFEAMASGLPIIASPVNGVPFEMKQGENGFFANYGDLKAIETQILKLLNNKKLAKKISQNNMKKAKSYDWDAISSMYLIQYNELLNNN